MKKFLALAAAVIALGATAKAGDLKDAVAADYPYVFDLYKHFHENPELSFEEKESSARMASELNSLGFDVTTGFGDKWVKAKVKADVGKVYPNVGGYGVIAVLKNGEGPTILYRADMDALPLKEKTGLAYSSKVTAVNFKGEDVPVMHACAHDSHMAMMIGVARRLVAMKDQWRGTLVFVAQPAEEIGNGALSIVDSGLYKKFPKPDFALAMHTSGWDPAGVIAYTPGYALANVDSVDILVHGRGAHGSAPQMGKDPIVLGAEIVNALQTLVSRENDPLNPAVVTVGAFNAGYTYNIIPDQAHLMLTIRSYKDEVRKRILDGVKRIARAQAESAGLPEELMPEVKIEKDYTPSTYNDPALTSRVMAAVTQELGAEHVMERPPSMGGEDFSQFSRTDEHVPALMFWVGSVDPAKWRAAQDGTGPVPPANHSPLYAPEPEPALKMGVEGMTSAILELTKKE